MKEKEQAISPICETALDQMLEALAQGAFSPEDLEAVCRAQPDCAAELRASYILWQEMDTMTVPEPSEDMRGNFLKTLAEFEQEAHPAKAKPVITLNWNHLRWAAVFVVGLLIGLLVRTPIANEVVASEEEENVSTLLATENPTTDRLLAIEKITLNMGLGEATKDKKVIEHALSDMAKISGQKAVVTLSRKSIAGFNIRDNWPIGCKVTLRNLRMYEFLDRLINIAIPRIRDFRGISGKAFDGRGNYNMGVKEQIIFPEIDYDKIDAIRGMDIAITTSAPTDAEAKALLEAFSFPFKN